MGVAMATVETMVREFGCQVGDIVVALGPSVGACCFTLDRRRALDFPPACVPDPQSAHPHVNLRLANRLRCTHCLCRSMLTNSCDANGSDWLPQDSPRAGRGPAGAHP